MDGFVGQSVVRARLPLITSVACALFFVNTVSLAETIYADQNKLFRSSRNVTALGADLFGDKVNLYTGALEFVQTDVSLPGNSRLPVAVGRRLIAGQEAPYGLFGGWDLEIPHLHGVYSKFRGWVPKSGQANARCSDFGDPRMKRARTVRNQDGRGLNFGMVVFCTFQGWATRKCCAARQIILSPP